MLSGTIVHDVILRCLVSERQGRQKVGAQVHHKDQEGVDGDRQAERFEQEEGYELRQDVREGKLDRLLEVVEYQPSLSCQPAAFLVMANGIALQAHK